MYQAGDHLYGETPKAERYFSMTEEEKDIELKKSIMRLRQLIYNSYRFVLNDTEKE